MMKKSALGIDYGKTKSNGIRSIFINYIADRDSSGGKILCAENVVPAVPEIAANADEYLHEVDCTELLIEENADPADPGDETKGNMFIAMAAEMMRRNLARQGIIVPAFVPPK